MSDILREIIKYQKLAFYYKKQKKFDDSVLNFKKTITLFETTQKENNFLSDKHNFDFIKKIFIELCEIFYFFNQHENIIYFIEKAIKYFPEPQFYRALILSSYKLSNNEKVIYYLNKLEEKNITTLDIKLFRIKISALCSLKRYDEAISFIEAMNFSFFAYDPLEFIKKIKTGESTLSVCVLTKNSEAFIRSCLESVKMICDEIIVNDTGSTDSTLEICNDFVKNESNSFPEIKIFQTKWEDDFSKARNFCLKQAKMDWILFLDSDQELEEIKPEYLSELMCDPFKIAYYVNVEDGNGQQARLLRLYRNIDELCYSGIIHEQIYQSIQNILKKEPYFEVNNSKIKIKEKGYNTEAQLIEKKERNIYLIKKALTNPKNELEKLYYHIKLIQEDENEFQNNKTEIEYLIDNYLDSNSISRYPFLESYYEIMIRNYLKKNDFRHIPNMIEKALDFFPMSVNINLLKAFYHEKSNEIENAENTYQLILSILDKSDNYFFQPVNTSKIKDFCLNKLKT